MPVHPGMMIKPELVERGISQKAFAKTIGVQPSHLSEVLNGKRALTTELAMKIEDTIGLPAKILLAAQAQYNVEMTICTRLWRLPFQYLIAICSVNWLTGSDGPASFKTPNICIFPKE